MFVNEITQFLYKELEEQHKEGHFDDVQYAYLNSMIDDIGYINKIALLSISVKDFGEKFEEYGGDVPRFEKNFKNYARSNTKVRIAQRLGHAVIRAGVETKEAVEHIQRRLNRPLCDKLKEHELIEEN